MKILIILTLVIPVFATCLATHRRYPVCRARINKTLAAEALAQSTKEFAEKFLQGLAKDVPGNLIESSFSAQIALAMAAYGAGGTTATQMRSVLNIPDNDEFGQIGYQTIIEMFNNITSVALSIADKIYTASWFEVNKSYEKVLAEKFLSSSQSLDFVNDAAGSASTINTWCANETNNIINQVVTADDLPPATAMVLVNAVYFKGQWDQQFDSKLTQDNPFYVNADTTKNVSTMIIRHKYPYSRVPQVNASFIELPYVKKEFSMIILLPDGINAVQSVLDNLDNVNLTEISSSAVLTTVDLYLPKFELESSMNLQKPLTEMGMGEMFEDSANFTRINATVPIKIGKVIQKAYIKVDEEGSTAAAVTVVAIRTAAVAQPVEILEFRVNRGFLYWIIHVATGIPLFSGVVTNPA